MDMVHEGNNDINQCSNKIKYNKEISKRGYDSTSRLRDDDAAS